jgi:hypothetical protein
MSYRNSERASAISVSMKCGYREVGRATYRNASLIYFEMLE